MEVGQQAVPQLSVDVSEPTHASEARRAAIRMAEQLGFGETDRGSIAIVATELSTNLLKHARDGKLICETIGQNGTRGLRILAIDKGPGIHNIGVALQDGYSTSGTAGNGFGAVRRLSSDFDVYSAPNVGTCVVADFWPNRKTPAISNPLQIGVISLPVRGEPVCGDGWAVKVTADKVFILVVDGLGHGHYAAEAAREAERVLIEGQSESPASILHDCHDALRKTRGAAAAVAAIHKEKGTLSFAGMGNISATLFDGGRSRGIASHNGTVGHQLHRIQEFMFPWNENSFLIMHSDGLTGRWDLAKYPGLGNKHASLLASVLYRDFARTRDDATVLVAKNLL